MTKDEIRDMRYLCVLSFRSDIFISNGIGYRFQFGHLRQMNIMWGEERLPRSTDDHYGKLLPSNYWWSGVCVDVNNILEHGVDFIGTEEQVWNKIMSSLVNASI